MTLNKNIGMLLLAVYFDSCRPHRQFFGLYFGVIPGIIALLAGIFIILGALRRSSERKVEGSRRVTFSLRHGIARLRSE
jgi:hypothetical protein